MDKYEKAAAAIAGIEQEMKDIGFWQPDPLLPEAYNFRQAFAADTMAFSQWLQFIFIPRVKEIIENRTQFPSGSQVGIVAVKEFEGNDRAEKLVRLLNEFDALFG